LTVELRASSGTITQDMLGSIPTADKLHKLIAVSESLQGNAAFSRQVRRKFV
jgi:hypothetical protein